MTRFRKICRFLHRELGFLAVGLTLAYAISGVAVNHTDSWNPSYEQVRTTRTLTPPGTGTTDAVAPLVLDQLALAEPVLNVWRATEQQLRVIIPSGTIDVDLLTGEVREERLVPRPLLRDVNFLHLNQGKGAWTWIADGYAVILAILALSGIFLVKGRKGLGGRGGVLMALGLVLPIAYVMVEKYL
ncbi:MAG: PepSY-associated TM helix domain-containing protein [Candidatus Krumholzibacteriia bacterium]